MKNNFERNFIFLIVFSVFSINLIVGSILNLAPMIFKQNPNLNPWLVGIFPTAYLLIMNIFGASKFINNIALKLHFKFVVNLYIFVSIIGLILVHYTGSDIVLFIYTLVVGFIICLRTLNITGIIMLNKDNSKLMYYKELGAAISGIIGLFLGQLLIDLKTEYFFIFVTISSLISFILMFIIKIENTNIEPNIRKSEINYKEDFVLYKKTGLILGIQSGVGTIFIGLSNYLFILSTNNIGYYKVFQSILIMILLIVVSRYIKNTTFIKVNLFRSFTFILILISTILLTLFKSSILILFFTSILISIHGATINTLYNYLVNIIDSSDKEKYKIISTYYYKSITITSLIFIPISKIYEDFNTLTLFVFFILSMSVIILINEYLKKNI